MLDLPPLAYINIEDFEVRQFKESTINSRSDAFIKIKVVAAYDRADFWSIVKFSMFGNARMQLRSLSS